MSKPANFHDLADQMVRDFPGTKIVSVSDDHLEATIPPDVKRRLRSEWRWKLLMDAVVLFVILVAVQWGSQGEQEAYHFSTSDLFLASFMFTGLYAFGFYRGSKS